MRVESAKEVACTCRGVIDTPMYTVKYRLANGTLERSGSLPYSTDYEVTTGTGETHSDTDELHHESLACALPTILLSVLPAGNKKGMECVI